MLFDQNIAPVQAARAPSSEGGASECQPLTGIRVLDVSRVMAGPSCAQMLGDFGADVIRIEELSGDETRAWPPVVNGESSNYQSVNRNKRCISIDLKNERGQEIFQALVRKADVVLHSFLPNVAQRLGMSEADLKLLNPALVVCSISGFGTAGPLAGKPGYDLTVQAYTGVMELTGDPEGPPMRAGLSMIDMSTGLMAFGAILMALLARARGNSEGKAVNVSLFETSLALLSYNITNLAIGGRKPRREGSGVGHLCPYQAFMCEDGYLLAGATNDASWQRMAAALGHQEWGQDPRFATNQARVANRAELIGLLAQIFLTKPCSYWSERLDVAKVTNAPVRTIDALLDDPQAEANEMLMRVKNRDERPLTLVGAPIRFGGQKPALRHLPPLLGEHTNEVLTELLGFTPEQVMVLREQRAVG